MKTPSSVILAAFLLFAPSDGRSAPVPASEQQRDAESKEREAAKSLEIFLLDPDNQGNSFVGDSANRDALAAVARAWTSKAKADDLSVLLLVSTPNKKSEARLRAKLARWTGEAQIKGASEASQATAFLEDALSKAKEVYNDPRAKADIDEAIQANEAAATPVPGAKLIGQARERREKQATGRIDVFGPERGVQELLAKAAAEGTGPGAHPAGGPAGAARPRTSQDVADALNKAMKEGQGEPKRPPVTRGEPPPVDAPVVLKALGSAEVAKEPGVLDRASSLAASDSKTIAADLANIRATMASAEIPNVNAINEGNASAIREFFTWLRSAKESDMPEIDYAILPKGEIGNYELGLLSKGDIKVNHFIRNEPAHARASVVVHELYHYWDKKVARNHYANVSYGKIDPANKHIHEYDAYLATSLYWQMVKKEGDASPLARVLDRIPTDPGEVRDLVNKGAGK